MLPGGVVLTLARRAAAEGIGTGALLAAVVGSGIMAERISGGNGGVALLANSIATGGILCALIFSLESRTGAHLNPLVTVGKALRGEFPAGQVLAYTAAQVLGALAGVIVAHVMFDLPLLSPSAHGRNGFGPVFSEVAATFGLMTIVFACGRAAAPFAVSGYIVAAYWFTASTSFANPAVTIARSLTDTFAGIRPADAPAFIGAEILGAGLAVLFFRWLEGRPAREAA